MYVYNCLTLPLEFYSKDRQQCWRAGKYNIDLSLYHIHIIYMHTFYRCSDKLSKMYTSRQYTFIAHRSEVSLGWNGGLRQAVLSAGSQEDLLPCLFIKASCSPGSWPFLHLQSQLCSLFPSSLILTLLSPFHKDPCDFTGSAQIIQDNHPSQDPYLNDICKVPFAVTVSYWLGVRLSPPLEDHYSICHRYGIDLNTYVYI